MSALDPSSPTRASRRADEAATAAVAARAAKKRKKRRIVGWSVTGAAVVLLGAVGFAGYQVYERAMDIRGEMVKAQALIPTVTSSAAALDFDAAGAAIDQASAHTANAVELADDPLQRHPSPCSARTSPPSTRSPRSRTTHSGPHARSSRRGRRCCRRTSLRSTAQFRSSR